MIKVVLTIWTALFLQTISPSNSTIEGVVHNASNGAPLSGVQVTAVRISNPGAARTPASKPVPRVLTDNSGKFAIKDVAGGTYRVYAVRAGFGAMEYKERPVSRVGEPVDIEAGQSVGNIDFNLPIAGVVTGRVTDASGGPLARIDVQVLSPVYDGRGTRSFRPVANAATDDLGQYRIFWITPGRYYLRAAIPFSSAEAMAMAETLVGTGNTIQNSVTQTLGAQLATMPPPPSDYGNMYYPGVTNAEQAQTLDIPSGPAPVNVDFRLRLDTAFHVRGRVVDKQTGQPPRNVSISLHAVPIGEGLSKTVTDYHPDTGTFEVPDVRPGSYTMTAIATNGGGILGALSSALENNPAPNPPRGGRPSPKSAMMHIDVSNVDVDNVTLKLAESVNIEGHLTMSSGAAISGLPGFERIHVRLVSTAVPAPSPPALAVVANGRPQVQTDGSFSLTAETNCDCEVVVAGLPADVYVQSIRLGDLPVEGERLTIPDLLAGALQIAIAPDGGRIEGTIVDSNGQAMKGVEAVLIPEKRASQGLYKTAVSDTSGQFTLRGIAPGPYKIFAWPDIEENGYRNGEILKRYPERGQSIEIKDASPVKLRITAIP